MNKVILLIEKFKNLVEKNIEDMFNVIKNEHLLIEYVLYGVIIVLIISVYNGIKYNKRRKSLSKQIRKIGKDIKDTVIIKINRIIVIICFFPIVAIYSGNNENEKFLGMGPDFYLGIMLNTIIFTYIARQVSKNANKNINEYAIWSLYNLSERSILKFRRIFKAVF